MSKLIYTVKRASIDNYKRSIEIRHGDFWVGSIFCNSLDLTKHNTRNKLNLYDEDHKIIVTFYIRMSQLKGIEYIDIKDYRHKKLYK